MSDVILETTCPSFVRAFGAIVSAATDDDTRPHMHAINVTVDSMKVMFEATNGHWFARWVAFDEKLPDVEATRWINPNGRHSQFLIPLPSMLKALDIAKRWKGPIIEISENEIRIPSCDYDPIKWETPCYLPEMMIDGKPTGAPARKVEFPYSYRLWPDYSRKPSQDVPLSSDYLIDISRSFKHAYERPKNKHENSAPTFPAVYANFGGDLDPIVFRSDDVKPLTCLVMPCRK